MNDREISSPEIPQANTLRNLWPQTHRQQTDTTTVTVDADAAASRTTQ